MLPDGGAPADAVALAKVHMAFGWRRWGVWGLVDLSKPGIQLLSGGDRLGRSWLSSAGIAASANMRR